MIGLPATDKNAGTDAATDVTVPVLLVYPLGFDAGYAPSAVSAAAAVVAEVPPLAIAKVPARVIVPEVVTGPPEVVKPVVPPDTSTLVTVPSGLTAQDVSAPLVVRYFPEFPVCDGANALNAALLVICPVPPLATGKAVPL